MRLRPEARVGLVVFLALIALAAIYWFFGGLGLRSGTYPVCAIFQDVMRLARGAEVRMAGVLIGKVQEINLTEGNKARVMMRISRRFENSIPSDSTARITTGGLTGVGEYYVEIIPGSSAKPVEEGVCLETAPLPKLDDLLMQVQDVVGGLQESVASVNDLLQDPELRSSFRNSIRNVETVTERAVRLVEGVQDVVTANRPEIDRALANAAIAAENFAAVSRDVRVAVERGGLENVSEIIASAGRTSENLEAVSRELRELAEDETISAQVRETIESTREAARGAAEIVRRVERAIGGRRGGREAEDVRPGPVPGRGSRFDLFAKTESGDVRVDYNLTLPGRGDDFYRIGLFDVGESTKLNLQFGEVLDRWSALRYGLYASKIGVGYDRLLADDLALQLDLFRPNDPRLEAKLRYDFSQDFGAWIGVEDAFGEGGALFGLQYRR